MPRPLLHTAIQVQLRLLSWTHPVRPERGANLVEYAMLLALIVIVCIGAVRAFGAKVPSGFSSATTAL